jgi:predicted ATPase
MGELSLHRYEIRRVLGRGGTGTVYEAFDTKTHAVVALKTVEAAAAEDLYRLKHEFRVLADVQHQNLVHFGELACEKDTWFFTMELVPGVNFIEHVRPSVRNGALITSHAAEDEEGDVVTRTLLRTLATGTRYPLDSDTSIGRARRGGPVCSEARLRSALAQLVEALSALHEAGHVHRDVKPSNVMVSHDGRVVLLDFGLVLALAGGEASSADRMGTPSYMAPEQVECGAVGPAADWYAVGTMLYVALTGSLPFADASDILTAKLHRDAPWPGDVAHDVPPDLDSLCRDLLHRDPRQRPGEDEIRARLGMPPRAAAVSTASEPASPFVGRDRELATLAAALREVAAGRPRAVVVEGEPGVGKTALVHRFLARTPGADRPLLLAGRCYEQEAVPFQGVDSVIDAVSEHLLTLGAKELAPLLAGGVRYLATVFPVLRRVPLIDALVSGARAVASQAGLREHAFGECTRLFAALARERPLAVFLDDLQWIDADSLALLERSVLPASGTPCLFIATLRTGMELPAGVAALRASAERVAVSGLSDDESRSLWDALRRADGEVDAVRAERDAATREAAGHPLFLAELARAARAGRFAPQGGALLDVLRARIDRHDPIERAFLEMTAIAGAPTPYQVVARAAELDVGDCLSRLGALKAAQLVRITVIGDERCVEPYHDRIREALSQAQVDRPRALALRYRLGEALLDATPAEALRERVFAIVQHLHAGRELALDDAARLRIAELDLLASREARLATAYAQAREHAGIGIELAMAAGGWDRAFALCRDLHLARMEAEHLLGDRDGARAVFDAARARLRSATDLAALWDRWITLETGRGRFREAIDAGREGLRELGMPVPAMSRFVLLAQYARTRLAQRGRSLVELEAMPPLRDARLEGALQILMSIGPVAFFVDTHLMAWVNMRIAEVTMRHGLSDMAPFGFAGYGLVLAGIVGRREEAAAFGELALRLVGRQGNDRLAAKLYVQNGGYLRHWVRPFPEAKELLRTAHRLGVQNGDAAYEVYAATILSVVTFCESATLAQVEETGAWARDVGARRRIKDMTAVPDIHARYAAALRGESQGFDLGDAVMSDAELRAGLGDQTTPVAIFYYHFTSAELAFLSGDLARATERLTDAAARTRGIFAIPTTVELCFLEALVAAQQASASSGWQRALRIAAVASRCRRLEAWARSCPANYRPQAMIARAELLRILGSRLARGAYERAIAAARQAGAPKREAIALDLAAAHAAARGDRGQAAAYARRAIEAYRRWGAHALADARLAAAP